MSVPPKEGKPAGVDRLAQIAAIRPINKQDSLLGFVSVVTITEADRDALVEIAKAARVVGDMHESGEGFQWVGSEDDTEALDAICSALARLDSGEGK